MPKPNVTPAHPIDRIFNKAPPWTDGERRRVQEWLWGDERRTFLVGVALWNMGGQAQLQDAEDAWADFSEKHLDAVMLSYDPSRGRTFWTSYLIFCFLRECRRGQRKLQHQRSSLVPLPLAMDARVEAPDLALVHDERVSLFWRCILHLTEPHRTVLVMRHFAELSIAEIADALELTETYVKVLIFRAKQQLKACVAQN